MRRPFTIALACGLLSACVTTVAPQDKPAALTATWFGNTNHLYQVGTTTFMQDGQVSTMVGKTLAPAEAVDKVWTALQAGGATPPAWLLIGHDHTEDHSLDTPLWAAKFPAMNIIGPKSQCDRLARLGVKNTCLALTPAMSDGRYVLQVGPDVQVRPVRWLHSNHSGCVTNNFQFPTWGFLVQVATRTGPVTIFTNDSGSGDKLDQPVVDPDTGTYEAPLKSLTTAMNLAGASRLDLWQGGSETRVIKQARQVVPAWRPKAFQPQHWAELDADLFQGIAYRWFPGATFTRYLADQGVSVVEQQNFFDAIAVDTTSTRRLSNPAVKSAIGLPVQGEGPRPLRSHPRLAKVPSGECPGD